MPARASPPDPERLRLISAGIVALCVTGAIAVASIVTRPDHTIEPALLGLVMGVVVPIAGLLITMGKR